MCGVSNKEEGLFDVYEFLFNDAGSPKILESGKNFLTAEVFAETMENLLERSLFIEFG